MIDQIYVKNINNISNSGVINVNTSDHFPVFVCRKLSSQLKRRKGTHFTIKYRNWKNVDNKMISEKLEEIKLNEEENDVNKACNDLTENIQKIIKKSSPC